jgi:UDP:flavonoid glycosyltransferase YjiC (YdhE family)
MLALPLTLDQPSVAAHLVRLGVAKALAMDARSTEQIQMALDTLLRDNRYRQAAGRIQSQLLALHGLDRAADIIEARLSISGPPTCNIPLTTT